MQQQVHLCFNLTWVVKLIIFWMSAGDRRAREPRPAVALGGSVDSTGTSCCRVSTGMVKNSCRYTHTRPYSASTGQCTVCVHVGGGDHHLRMIGAVKMKTQ